MVTAVRLCRYLNTTNQLNVPTFFHGCHSRFIALDKLVTTGIKADSIAYTHTNYLDNDVISVLDKHGLPMLNCLLRPEQANASYMAVACRGVALGPSFLQVQQPGLRFNNNNNNNNNNLFTAIVLSPGGSGYFTCIQNMKLVTNKFKSGGLHEKHVVATGNVGNRLSVCL